MQGEKNNGFDVLYHNMKHGQISSKELTDFIRERYDTLVPYTSVSYSIDVDISTWLTTCSFSINIAHKPLIVSGWTLFQF